MADLEARGFESPDEVRTPDKTTIELVNLAGGQIGRYTFAPGWRWSECIKPVAQTETCRVEHIGYVVSGTLHVKQDDRVIVGKSRIVHAMDVTRHILKLPDTHRIGIVRSVLAVG